MCNTCGCKKAEETNVQLAAERRYTGKKKTKAKKSTTGKYICPACKERFSTRKEANKHQYEKNHTGAIIVEEKKEEKKKEETKKTTSKSGKKVSKKRELMNEAQKAVDTAVLAGMPEKTAIAQVAQKMKQTPKKIKAWLDTLKGEKKRTGVSTPSTPKKEQKEETEVEEVEEPKGTIHRFNRISEEAFQIIKGDLDKSSGIELHVVPETGNNLIYCKMESDYYAFDYLMFLHDFVEIEMDIGDIMYVLNYYSSKKGKLNNKLKIHDIAEKLDRYIDDVDDGGCILNGYDSEESLTISQIMGRMSEFEMTWMACAGGEWEKPVASKKEEPKKEETKALPAPKSDGQQTLADFVDKTVQGEISKIVQEEKDKNAVKTTVENIDDEEYERFLELNDIPVNSLTESQWNELQGLYSKYERDEFVEETIREDDVPLDGEKIQDEGLKQLFEPAEKSNKTKEDDKKFNPDSKTYNQLDGYGAEEDASVYYGSYYSNTSSTTPKKKPPHFSPVYGMDVNRIYVDRLIDIMKFMPPEKDD
tara:strand:+ start:18567 stop:20162 length:1596 start_codon:yes stop_codon:yes gene_type:complete